MSRTDNRANNNNNGSKFKSKPSFSREKSYAVDENDIIKNEQMLLNQKEERDKIRQHNLKVASGEINSNTEEVVNSESEDEANNSNKRRKEKKDRKKAEKKALGSDSTNNAIVKNHSSIPDSDTEEN